MEDKTKSILFACCAVLVATVPVVIGIQLANAYDVVPTVDPPNDRTLLSGTPTQYRFGSAVSKNVTYSDGSVVPTLTVTMERYNQTTGHWDIIGSVNDHMHKVKVDNTDKEDISVGLTIRFNPKWIPPTAPEPVID